MFSKFKLEKPSHVSYKRYPRHFENSANILSLPLIEAYRQQICMMRAEMERLKAKESIHEAIIQSQGTELTIARAEVFQLRQEIQLLLDEAELSALRMDPIRNRVKFNITKKPSRNWRSLQGRSKGKRLASTFKMQQKKN